MKFVVYVPSRDDSAVSLSLNQMFSDTSHSQTDHPRAGKGMGELGKRYREQFRLFELRSPSDIVREKSVGGP